MASEIVAATGMEQGGRYFWDPAAAVAVTRPGLVRSAVRRLDVLTTGRTVVTSRGAPTRVVTWIDRPRFERELVATLLGGAPFRIPPHRADLTVAFDGRGCSYAGAARLTAGVVAVDTVNRMSEPFAYAAGRLDAWHTVADLKRYARSLTQTAVPPRWFTVDATGITPPRSGMTWLANLPTGTTGDTVFVCAAANPPRAWVAKSVPVFASG